MNRYHWLCLIPTTGIVRLIVKLPITGTPSITGTAVRLAHDMQCGSTGLLQAMRFNWPITGNAVQLAYDRKWGTTGILQVMRFDWPITGNAVQLAHDRQRGLTGP